MDELINADLNPYNRVNQPHEYQAWYYENITKPKRQITSKLVPKNYFGNKDAYDYTQKKINKAPRKELIPLLFIDKDEYHYTEYLEIKSRDKKNTYHRKPAEAKALADEYYHDELQGCLKDPSIHHILNIVDQIARHPTFNKVEAWTLLELAYRWTWNKDDMPYRYYPQEITVNEEELYQIAPEKDLLDPVLPIKLSDWEPSNRKFIEFLNNRRHKNHPEEPLETMQDKVDNINKYRAEDYPKYYENTLRSLSKLKDNWTEAVNEAFTPLIWNHNGRSHTWLNAIVAQYMDIYDHLYHVEPSHYEE